METWQICLVSYLVVAFGIAVIAFKSRRRYSPTRTKTAPAIIACLISGLVWGLALPLIVIKFILVQVKREAKDQHY